MISNKDFASKKIAIWGTGKISSRFSNDFEHDFDIYIDNDIEKRGNYFNGKRIVISDEIYDYKKFYIIIACKAYEEIKDQLQKKGLIENQDFIFYTKVVDNEKIVEGMVAQLEEHKELLKMQYQQFKNGVLVIGSMITFEPNSIGILNEISNSIKEPFLLVSERPGIEEKAQKEKWIFPYYILPRMLLQNEHLCENFISKLEVIPDIVNYISEREYRVHAKTNFQGKNPDIAEGYADIFIYYADKFMRFFFEFMKPKRVYIWNLFYPFHELVNNICKEFDIDISYVEYGVLPGTFLIEKKGQMGESFPATEIEAFQRLSINNDDMLKAKRIYSYLSTTRINRRQQPDNAELEAVMRTMDNRPLVVYLGQNDYESGIYPYSQHAQQFHSPIFHSSYDAAVYLAELAQVNGWNIVYKPHPLCINDIPANEEKPKNLFVITKCNINDLVSLADLNVTILSTAAYVSLTFYKPVLMLGYTQLRGKGCTYEAFDLDSIEDAVKDGLKYGYTDSQRQKYVEHIARIMKYYAYDDGGDRFIRYGMDWRSLIEQPEIEL